MITMESNIVVIGGGGAGFAAALTAMAWGIKNITVVEKRFVTGGNSAMAGGMVFAVESHFQKEAGIKTTCDDVFKETLAFHHYDRVNAKILRALIEKSASTIQWLEDTGVEYELRNGHSMKNTTTPFGGFARATKLFTEKVKAGGGQVLVNTEVTKILRTSTGEITGVVAVTKDGEQIQINTKSVVLTTGGFTGNRELLHQYFPQYYDDNYWTDAVPLMGDGIQLASEAGAYVENYCTLIRENGYCFDKSGKIPNRIHMSSGAVWVNKLGQRYCNETIGHDDASTNALVTQPGKIGFALFDDHIIQMIVDRPNPFSVEKDQNARDIILEEAKEGKWARVSNSLDDIATWIGADPAVLKATVEEYNGFCDKGRDGLFVKDKEHLIALRKPPYYAVKFRPLMVDTIGPVKINDLMQVLDTQGRPIPGFYAAGVITSGWQGNDYHLFGSALGFSLTSGRIAGENAAAYSSR